MTTILLWRAPSGRLHAMRRCSGAAPAHVMRGVRMRDDELAKLEEFADGGAPGPLCRCARRQRDLARERMARRTG
jgi:hypothetical protein